MRIAVSGTHCSGKSTLIEDFIAVHRDYVYEPEPYEWLADLHGEPFAEVPDVGDFLRQLEMCVERLCGYERGARVIAERSPLDFLAYILALGEERIESAVELAARGLEHVDLLVVLPLVDADGIDAPDSEDLDLREAMNDRLLEMVTADEFQLLGNLRVIEIHGTRAIRLDALAQAMQQ